MRSACVTQAGALVYLVLLAASASAQGVLPPKGEGYVALSYQNTLADGHLLFDGSRASGANAHDKVRTHTVTSDVELGITNKAAVSFTVPIVASQYNGGAPHIIGVSGESTTIDDGT